MSFLEYALEGQRDWEIWFTKDQIFLLLEENKTNTTIKLNEQRPEKLDEFILHIAKKLQNNGTLNIINSYTNKNDSTHPRYITLLKNLTPNYNLHIGGINCVSLQYFKNHLDVTFTSAKSACNFLAILITIRTQLYLVEFYTFEYYIYEIRLYPVYHDSINRANVFCIYACVKYNQTLRIQWDEKLRCMRRPNCQSDFSPVNIERRISEVDVLDITKTVLLEHIVMLGLVKSDNCWHQFCCVDLYDPRLFFLIGGFLFEVETIPELQKNIFDLELKLYRP